ncbi:MAG: hypothetical protein LBE13_09900 [Bacteroidales bacterium]|jgi:hypothetical protein|nr:hypothetical protein [Bacteroidales bacterium]
MTDRENSKLNMYQAILDICNANIELVKQIAAFVKSLSELTIKVNEIRQTEQNQAKTMVQSASLEKGDYEDLMVALALKISNALYVYAFENKDQPLLSLMSINKRTFYACEGNKKLRLARTVYESGAGVLDLVGSYGVTIEMIEDLHQAIVGYEANLVKPRDTIVVHKNYTHQLKLLFADADSLLYDKLDKLIILFKDTDFYNEYKFARNIISTSIRHKKDKNEEEEKNEE